MFRKSCYLVLGCLLLVVSGSTVFAETKEEAQPLEPLEVNAARNKLELEDLPTSASVITRKEIEEKNYINVEDMLRGELGLDVVQNGTLGSTSTVFIRGGGSSSTLVLVDGIQVNSNTLGSFNFAHIQPDNIERVEILRGAQSTIWGADAVGGVINIVTRRGKGKPKHYMSFEGGSFSTFKETLGSSGEVGNLDYSVSVTRLDSAGISSADKDNGNTEKDRYQNTSFSTRIGRSIMEDRGRGEVIVHYIDSHIEFDSFGLGGPVDGPPLTKTESIYISTPVQFRLLPWWELQLNPNFAYDASKTRQTGSDSNIFSRTYTIDIKNDLTLGDYFSLILGTEYQDREGINATSRPRLSADQGNVSFYMQGVVDYDDALVLTSGFRYDANDSFQDVWTYKFEGAYRFKQTGTRVRAAYSKGFRAPTINELFFPGFGNPNLLPEESRGWEVGLDQNLWKNRIRLSVVYFDTIYDNLIAFRFIPLTGFIPVNVNKATSRGVETGIYFDWAECFSTSLKYTWNDVFDEATQFQLRRRAKHKFQADMIFRWKERFKALMGWTFRGDTLDGTAILQDYWVLRSNLEYAYNKNLKLTLRGENLTDEDYQEIAGFGTAGIAVYAGFTYEFN